MPKAPGPRLLSKLGFATVSATAVVAPASSLAPPRATIIADEIDIEVDDDNQLPASRPAVQIDGGDDTGSLARDLAFVLSRAPGLVATEVAATWALSRDAPRRLVIAEALGWWFRLVGDDVVIDHLSRDSDPAIRAAAARAAWTRRATGGDEHVLERLAADPDPEVRRVVGLAISR